MSEAERTRRLNYRKVRKKWISLQAMILAIVILATFVSAVVYFRLDKTRYINYTEQCAVDYGVYLKENEFYTESYLGKDQAYVASLIEKVVAEFEYKLLMDSTDKVDFRYSYQIDAILQIKDKTSGAILFDSVHEVLPLRTEERTANGLIIREDVQLDYAQFNDVANKFINTYELKNTTSQIVLQMRVNVIGASDAFSNSTESNQYLVDLNIPLTTQVVQVNMKTGIPEEENKILACNNQDAGLLARCLFIVFLCVSILFAIAFVVFVYLTRNTDITYEIRVSRLLRSYKPFIQKINNPFDVTGYQVLMVDTFNEMLEIRDTLQSPILMNENTDKTCTRFLIPTNTKILYVYELKVDDYDEIYSANNSEEELVELEPEILEETPELIEEQVASEEAVAFEQEMPEDSSIAVSATPEESESIQEDDQGDGEADENNLSNGYSKVRRSFMAKLIQSTEDKKQYYSEIKNELLSYRSVKARVSWNTESFNKGRTYLAKLAIRGKTLCLFLALDPAEFVDSKYFYTDVSDITRYSTVPFMIKIKSNRGVKHAKELIEIVAGRFELTKKNGFEPVDYMMPHQDTRDLIAQGLIKDPLLEYGTLPLENLPTDALIELTEDDLQLLELVPTDAILEALKEPTPSIEDIDYVDVEEPEVEDGVEVVDVVWKEKETENTLHRYDPNGVVLNRGDIVLVPAKDEERGNEIIRKAAVAHSNHKVDSESVKSPLKKIIGVLKRKMQDVIRSNIE